MKRVFISHPFSGDEVENTRKADEICKKIMESDVDVLPVSPLHLFSFLEDDGGVREAIMTQCYYMILSCDELWSFGDSKGCVREEAWAYKANVNIRKVQDIDKLLSTL